MLNQPEIKIKITIIEYNLKVHYGLCENGELKYRDMNEGKNISDTLVVLTTNILTSSVIYY